MGFVEVSVLATWSVLLLFIIFWVFSILLWLVLFNIKNLVVCVCDFAFVGEGYYQGPPVMAPPQYQYAAPPPRREPGFLEGW